MIVSKVFLDCNFIRDWPSFHEAFAKVFGFPGFYGQNMDAWVDCMKSLNAPQEGMSSIHCPLGSVVTLELIKVRSFATRCPEQYKAFIECSAFVNWSRIAAGGSSVLAPSFWMRE